MMWVGWHTNACVQVEEVRNPALKGKPVGVTQKYLIVTSNYEARARGVTKLTGIQEALAACPELQLVCPFDLGSRKHVAGHATLPTDNDQLFNKSSQLNPNVCQRGELPSVISGAR